jgi:transcriptional regulator with XRE-family HTH domain
MSRSRKPQPTSAADVVARRVRELRRARGWSAQYLADRLRELDPSTVLGTRDVIANLETGRRPTVSFDEVLLLAFALDEPPSALVVPHADEAPLRVGPIALTPRTAYRWIGAGGMKALPEQNADRYGALQRRMILGFPPDAEGSPSVSGVLAGLVLTLNEAFAATQWLGKHLPEEGE